MSVKYLFLLACCCYWESNGKIRPRSGNHSDVALQTGSRLVTVRHGSPLHLNCTITGYAANLTVDQLFWSRRLSRLSVKTREIDNRTLQLAINSTSWSDSGEYWCTLSTDGKLLRSNVSVAVGDVPSSPENLYWNNFELLPRITWTAVAYDGRLPVTYYVHYQCHGMIDCSTVETYDPCVLKHVPHRKYNCLVRYIAEGVKYSIWVTAVNSVGLTPSKKIDVFVAFNDLASAHTFPPPHTSEHMVTTTPQTRRSLTVRLTRRDNWKSYGTIFNVTYRGAGDSSFQVWCNKTQSDQLILQGSLKPYTMYEVFISARLVNAFGQLSMFSEPIGPFLARTAEEAPGQGPTIVNCSTVPWKEKMNATIKWKPVPAGRLNGLLRKYQLVYVNRSGSFIQTIPVHNNTLRTKATIAGLNSSSSYDMWIQACTVECSPSSETKCTVSLDQSKYTPTSSSPSNIMLIVVTIASFLAVATVIVVLWTKKYRCSRTSSETRSILERIGDEGPEALFSSDRTRCSEEHQYESMPGDKADENEISESSNSSL